MEVIYKKPKFDRVLSREDCEEIINQDYSKNPRLISFKVSKISDNVLGFLGEHLLLNLTFKENNKINEKIFFLKCLPQLNQNQKEYVEAMGIFQKEAQVYKNLIQEFLKLTTVKFAPTFYFCNEQCMVLENLSLKNFSVCENNYLTMKKCRSALKCIAAFHAASLIYEEQRSTDNTKYRINEHFQKEIEESTFSYKDGHPRNSWRKTVTDCLARLAKYFSTDDKIADKVTRYISNDIKEILKPSKTYRNVITHDDLWCNNMMFDSEENCILVDFQLTRYTPPIFDVLLTLYINLERNVLEKTKSELLDYYYACLQNELEAHCLNIDKILDKKQFLDSEEHYKLPALVEACMYGTNVYLPKELSKKIVSDLEIFEDFSFKNRQHYILPEFEHNLDFRKRFSDVLLPLYKMFE